MYVYSFTDAEYESNLLFFLAHGVRADDGADYVLVVQEGEGIIAETRLPADLPPNVRVLRHRNACYDWGTFGWALDRPEVNASRYRHVVLLNGSVRGPFLPAYWPAALHWSSALTSRLTGDVRLVGATVSCEASRRGGVPGGELRRNPHVQSYLLAMDQTALAAIRADGDVLRCWNSYHDAVWHAELGASAAVLAAGHNIASLQLRFQGVDWRDQAAWSCNAGLNPYGEKMYDGIDVNPIEVLFVKIKEHFLEANWTAAVTGAKYAKWIQAAEERLREERDKRIRREQGAKGRVGAGEDGGAEARGDAGADAGTRGGRGGEGSGEGAAGRKAGSAAAVSAPGAGATPARPSALSSSSSSSTLLGRKGGGGNANAAPGAAGAAGAAGAPGAPVAPGASSSSTPSSSSSSTSPSSAARSGSSAAVSSALSGSVAASTVPPPPAPAAGALAGGAPSRAPPPPPSAGIDDLTSNAYVAARDSIREAKTAAMRKRGSACFDADHYRQRNPDLPAAWGKQHLWKHLVEHGQHEGRVFRFRCPEGVVDGPEQDEEAEKEKEKKKAVERTKTTR